MSGDSKKSVMNAQGVQNSLNPTEGTFSNTTLNSYGNKRKNSENNQMTYYRKNLHYFYPINSDF